MDVLFNFMTNLQGKQYHSVAHIFSKEEPPLLRSS